MADEETLPTKLPSLEGEVIAPSSRQVGPVGAVNDIGPNYFGVSIRDAINAKRETVSDATIDSYERTVSRLEKMGFNTTADLSTINNHQAMDEIIDKVLENKKEYTPNVKARLGSDIKALIEAHLPEGVANAVQSFEKKARTKTKTRLFDFTVQRAAKPLILPEFDVFSKAIHKGIMSIPDKETRVFALTKLLSGLRDTDITGIRIEPAEKGKEVAYLRSSTKSLASISNKGRPIDYNLGSNIFAILDDLRQDVVEAKVNREKLFSKSPATMKKTVQDAIRISLKEAGAEIIDTRGDKVVPFTLGALRKNIFDIIDEEESLRVANQVLGHSVKDTGLNYYKPGRKGRIGNVASAMDTFFNIYAKEVGYDSPKNLLKVYGLERASLTVPDTLKVNPAVSNVQSTASDATASLLGPAEDSEALAKRMETSATRIENAATRIKDVSPSTTAELLGDPVPEEPKPKLANVSDADLKDIGYSDSEIANIQSSEASGNYLEAEQTRIEAKERMRLEKMESAKNKISSFMKSGAAKKLAIGAATTAIGIGLTGGAKAADVVLDIALDPTNMGGTAEDASTADLERGVATGEALPRSGSYRANEQELQSMQRELQGRKDSEVRGQQVMDTTPAGSFARQQAQQFKSTLVDDYEGFIPTR